MKRRPGPAPSLPELEALLGYTFQSPSLLELALTHRSLASDAGATDRSYNNERLEFLGDAVLGLLVAEVLYQRFPEADEGDLTRMRVSVITRKHLDEVGAQLRLERWLRLGQTVAESGGRASGNIRSNTVEAVLAALYLDGGPAAARQFVNRAILGPALPGMVSALQASRETPRAFRGAAGDFKTELQEYLRAAGRGQPEYRLLAESGPDHRRIFEVAVGVLGESDGMLAQAEGPSKKQAQQQAARLALEQLKISSAAEGICP